ncbi:MAG: creatininase family protein [Dehalococcoidia bacterium]
MTEPRIHLVALTTNEVRERQQQGWNTVIQSFGSTEGHLAHLPLGTDIFQGSAIAERVARALGQAFVAPTIPVGFAEGLLSFPGSMSMRDDLVTAVAFDCCRSFAASGFRRVVLIVAHLGNARPLGEAAARARDEFPAIEIICEASPEAFFAPIKEVGEHLGVVEGAMKHAGHSETSMMLSLRPELVHLDRPPTEPPLTPLHALAEDFAGSSANAGERYLSAWTDAIVAKVRTGSAVPND